MIHIICKYNDGGRADAGYKGQTGDCVLRSIAIANEMPYEKVRLDLMECNRVYAETRRGKIAKILKKGRSVFKGVYREVYNDYIIGLGFTWVSTMQIGSGCQVHLQKNELPEGRLICRLSKHLTAVVDGTCHDLGHPNWKKDEDGNMLARCVYGYYKKN